MVEGEEGERAVCSALISWPSVGMRGAPEGSWQKWCVLLRTLIRHSGRQLWIGGGEFLQSDTDPGMTLSRR